MLLYHLDFAWVPGGFLGADVFFVLSGFLITSLIVRDIERDGYLEWRIFYRRRVRRLLPPLAMLLVGVALVTLLAVPSAAWRLRQDTLAALSYASNWWLILNRESYFEFTGRPPLLQHLWSLAIEGQFYLAWPICVVLIFRAWKRRGLAIASVLFAVVSTAAMAYIAIAEHYPDAGDPSRVYFGTDTHSMGLLIGAALAAIWSPWRQAHAKSLWSSARFTWTIGLTSLTATVAVFLSVREYSAPLYRGGFLIVSMFAGLLIVAASRAKSGFGALLGMQPWRWIGERSYGLYVWHWPIFMFTRPTVDLPDLGAAGILLRLGLTAAVTEFSYSCVERPILDGAIERWVARWRATLPRSRTPLLVRGTILVAPTAAIVAAVTIGLAVAPPPSEEMAADVAEAMGILNGGPTSVALTRTPSGSVVVESRAPVTAVVTAPASTASFPSASTVTRGDTAVAPPIAFTGVHTLTAIGDSVLLGARLHLERSIAGARIDAEVGRQAAGVLTRLARLRGDGLLAAVVVVQTGTNGFVTEPQLRQILAALSDRKAVIVVNAQAPRRWVGPNNELIGRVTSEYPNTVVADWAQVSLEHPEYFASDGVHLTPSGQQAFVGEVVRAGRLLPMARSARLPVPVTKGLAGVPVAASVGAGDEVMASGLGPLVPQSRPFAHDTYWDAIARCETGSNWRDGGQYSGGLGIYVGTWRGWGGVEFAPTPDAATREEQIIVANRIATLGWRRPNNTVAAPVGFSGWGCAKAIDPPQLVRYDPDSVLLQRFRWGQDDDLVNDLELILGVRRRGVYDQETWGMHLRELESRRLPRHLAP